MFPRNVVFVVFMGLSACIGHHQKKQSMRVFDLEGHRGCRGLMPENTIPAMIRAINEGVTTLEMDAVISRDKKVVVSHDPFFNHEISTKPDGSLVKEEEELRFNLYRMDYAEIKKFDVGSRPHPRFPKQEKMVVYKPLLSELIDSVELYCKSHHLRPPDYNIETKSQATTDGLFHPGPEEFVDLLVSLILTKNIRERVIIQSFDFRTLNYLHRKYPVFRTAMLIEADDPRTFEEQLKQVEFVPTIYSPESSLVNDALIKKCHAQKMLIIPWTVNEVEKMKELKQLGVDGLISDYPNFYRELK
jgi:glycerophosphoryl diester phosphodiesterase